MHGIALAAAAGGGSVRLSSQQKQKHRRVSLTPQYISSRHRMLLDDGDGRVTVGALMSVRGEWYVQ